MRQATDQQIALALRNGIRTSVVAKLAGVSRQHVRTIGIKYGITAKIASKASETRDYKMWEEIKKRTEP